MYQRVLLKLSGEALNPHTQKTKEKNTRETTEHTPPP